MSDPTVDIQEIYDLARRDKPGGWSKHIYNRHPDDVDVRATQIANKFLRMMVDYMIKETGVAPYFGVEINWGLTGETPENYRELIHRNIEKVRAEAAKNPRALLQPGIIERAYVDQNAVEVCTAPASPMATVAAVDAIKQMAFEASQLFNEEPKHLAAQKARKTLRPHYMRFYPQDYTANHGEHVNVSLAYLDRDKELYESKRRRRYKGKTELALDNLFGTDNVTDETGDKRFSIWHRLVQSVIYSYIAHDTLLSVGNRLSLHPEMPLEGEIAADVSRAHDIQRKEDHDKNYGNRVEIRSFHDSTSNISLSALAVTAVLCKTILTAKELGMVEPSDYEGSERIKMRPNVAEESELLRELSAEYETDELMPHCEAEAIDRFENNGMTLRMMQQVAKACAKTPEEEAELLAEIDEFKDLVIERAHVLIHEPFGGHARTHRALVENHPREGTSHSANSR